jgi:hypothetical protein
LKDGEPTQLADNSGYSTVKVFLLVPGSVTRPRDQS